MFGATNWTVSAITQVTLTFDGEQWRNGGNATPQSMVLEYGTGADFTTVATWFPAGTAFNWTSPLASTTAAPVDGNAAGRVAGVGGVLLGLGHGNLGKK